MNQIVEEKKQIDKVPVGWIGEQAQRKKISQWEVRGRLGIQSEYNGGSLDIIWKQAGDDFSMRLIAPLGAGTYLIQGNKTFAEIRFPDGKKKIINSIDEIFASTFDVDLPASALIDWVRGLPASALTLETIDWNEQGLMKYAEQSGWNIDISRYAGDEIAMPHAIYLSRDDNAELDIRLLLRRWLLDD
jgi:outer membrane lipoprotein LolB